MQPSPETMEEAAFFILPLSRYVYRRTDSSFILSPTCTLVLCREILSPGFPVGCFFFFFNQPTKTQCVPHKMWQKQRWNSQHPIDAQSILKAFKSCCGLAWAPVASLMLWRMSTFSADVCHAWERSDDGMRSGPCCSVNTDALLPWGHRRHFQNLCNHLYRTREKNQRRDSQCD